MEIILLCELLCAISVLNSLGGPPATSLAFSHINLVLRSLSGRCFSSPVLVFDFISLCFWVQQCPNYWNTYSFFAFSVESFAPLPNVNLNSRNPLWTLTSPFPALSYFYLCITWQSLPLYFSVFLLLGLAFDFMYFITFCSFSLSSFSRTICAISLY